MFRSTSFVSLVKIVISAIVGKDESELRGWTSKMMLWRMHTRIKIYIYSWTDRLKCVQQEVLCVASGWRALIKYSASILCIITNVVPNSVV